MHLQRHKPALGVGALCVVPSPDVRAGLGDGTSQRGPGWWPYSQILAKKAEADGKSLGGWGRGNWIQGQTGGTQNCEFKLWLQHLPTMTVWVS